MHQQGSSSSSSGSSGYNFMSLLRDLGPNGAYLPFGGGPRNCIGTGFAMTEAVLVLAMMLQRYELQPVTPAAGFPRPKPMLTLRPEAVPLRLLRRRPHQQQQQQQQV
jgi:cytochrome P450